MNIKQYFLTFLLCLSSFNSNAAVIDLFQWAFNIDGTFTESGAYPAGIDPLPSTISGSLDSSGLGTLSTEISGAGNHSIILMLDYEIDEPFNTYFNEYGSTGGTLGALQSWEIDEPAFIGDIYWNTLNGTLDNTNAVPENLNDDVAFALGWNFTLGADEVATIDFSMSDVLGTSGFYLAQHDAETGPDLNQLSSIYFWSDISISGNTPADVPEPDTLFLLSIGLLGLVSSLYRRKS